MTDLSTQSSEVVVTLVDPAIDMRSSHITPTRKRSSVEAVPRDVKQSSASTPRKELDLEPPLKRPRTLDSNGSSDHANAEKKKKKKKKAKKSKKREGDFKGMDVDD